MANTLASTVDTDTLLVDTLQYARQRDYVGWDLYDGESSRLLRRVPVDNRWLNLAVQQLVRRSPINLRPLLRVEQRRSYLGAALFALANFGAAATTGEESYRREGLDLVEWLVDNHSTGYSGFCGGHRHPLQGLTGKTPPGTPGIVGTAYAVRALLVAAEADDSKYRDIAHTGADFVVDDLDYTEAETGARISYRPDDHTDSVTLNANALGARLLLDLYDDGGDRALLERATAILDYVVSRQTDAGGWYYRDPPSDSHLSMDNFHNGFIVETLHTYHAITGTDRYAASFDRALGFYRETLFDADGAPNHDEESAYPKDIHDVAQGIVVFNRVGAQPFAERILRWGREHLYHGDGRFYHQRRRYFTDRTTLMRWCQAWMAYALAVRADAKSSGHSVGVRL